MSLLETLGAGVVIREIIWLEDIVDKLDAKHGVSTQEVREVLTPRSHYRLVETGHRADEDVYATFGRTAAGRYLVVFFVRKSGSVALIVSARDMTGKERRYYEKT